MERTLGRYTCDLPSLFPQPYHHSTPTPLMLAFLSPSWSLPKSTTRQSFESNPVDVSRLCLQFQLICPKP